MKVGLALLVVLLGGLGAWLWTPDLPRVELESRYSHGVADFREIEGVRLHVRAAGPANAPVVILVHGFGASLQSFDAWSRGLPDYRVIRFDLNGVIALTAPLLMPSNISIDGRGHQVTVTGKGFILAGSDDVIITNLAIEDVGPNSEDGLRIGDPTGPSERVVVDHVTFRATTQSRGDSANVDEAISIVFGSRDITLSWLKIEGWEKFILIGNGDAPQSVDSAITVSMHHIVTTATGRRHPQARYGVIDLWNCFFDDWRLFDWAFLAPYRESFGVQAQDGARLRFENSFVRRVPHSKDVGSQADHATRCESGGRIDAVNVQVAPGSTSPLQFGVGCSGTTGWVRPYTITLDPADAMLRTRLAAQAGNTL